MSGRDAYKPRKIRAAAVQADAVFAGTVRSVAEEGGARRAVFAVDRVWRGAPGQEVTIVTANSSAACGVDFREGAAYVVFADADAGGQLQAGACGHTAELGGAGPVVRALGEANQPPRVAGAGCTVHAAETDAAMLALLVLILSWRGLASRMGSLDPITPSSRR